MDAMLLTDLLLYDRMCERREERAERYVTVSVGFFTCGAFGCLYLPWINSKPDMWPALVRMFGLVHLNFEGSVYPNKTCGQFWMRMFGACG